MKDREVVTLEALDGFIPKVMIASGHCGVNKRLTACVNLKANTIFYEVSIRGNHVITTHTIEDAITAYNDLV
jgi:hypothetical protein